MSFTSQRCEPNCRAWASTPTTRSRSRFTRRWRKRCRSSPWTSPHPCCLGSNRPARTRTPALPLSCAIRVCMRQATCVRTPCVSSRFTKSRSWRAACRPPTGAHCSAGARIAHEPGGCFHRSRWRHATFPEACLRTCWRSCNVSAHGGCAIDTNASRSMRSAGPTCASPHCRAGSGRAPLEIRCVSRAAACSRAGWRSTNWR